jgi:AraC family L-rhamnose operon transcriptional activator RhaR
MAIARMSRREVFPDQIYPIHADRIWLDEPVGPHAHDFCELAIILTGSARYRSQYGTRRLAAGDVVAVRPGAWHEFASADALEVANIYIGAELFSDDLAWVLDHTALTNLLFGTGEVAISLDPEAAARAAGWLDQLRRCRDRNRVARTLQLRSLLGCVLAEFAGANLRTDSAPPAMGPAARTALLAMAEDPSRTWSIPELARLAGVSASRLQHQFAEQLGVSPLRWLNQYRAEQMAVRLAAGSQPVAEIGRAVGWPDPNYAARRFRAAHRMSPTDYRRRFAFGADRVR